MFTLNFPDVPADIRGDGPPGPQGTEQIAAFMHALLEEYGAPRCPEILARFIADHLPAGDFYVHGCGTHSRMMLDLIAAFRPDITVRGMLDRLATETASFAGRPVYRPDQIRPEDAAHILVAHTSFEGEMVRSLLAAGVPPERIIRVYSSRSFAELASRAPAIGPVIPANDARCLIVSCSSVGIVSDRDLQQIFPPATTTYLHIGRQNDFKPHPGYRSLDLKESLRDLLDMIRRIRPEIIYVRPIIYKNYLPSLIKFFFPEIKVVSEYYDFSFLWRPRDLMDLFGLDMISVRMLREAELIGTRIVDFIVTKRGGTEWETITADWSAGTALYFPLVADFSDHEPKPATRDFCYAGFLPSPKFLLGFDTGYNFLNDLEELCSQYGYTAVIYNSGHTDDMFEDSFRAYYERFSGHPIDYRGRIPYAALMRELHRVRFGWLCEHRTGFQGDRNVGICNRWTGYVSAGIPVLMDSGWHFMADLVRRYDAGIIVGSPRPDVVAAAVAAADHDRLRQGVKALRDHMIEQNRRAMLQLAAVLEQPLPVTS